MDPGRGRERADLTDPAGRSARGSPRFALASPFLWHVITLSAGAAFLMYVNRGQWFFGDEWDFLTDRTVTIGMGGLFEPHNEHWSTMPILLYGAVFRVFGISSYAPYVALVVTAHIVVVHLAWRVMLRGGVSPWIATAFCAAFIPFGPGAENLLWAFQIGFVGSVACGLGAILMADHAEPFGRRDVAVWSVSILGLTFSAISVPLVGAAAAVAWMRRGFRAGVLTAAVPAAIYLLWLFTAGRRGLTTGVPVTVDSLRVFPQFLWLEVSSTLSLGTRTFATGLVPLILGGVGIWVRRRRGLPMATAALGAAVGGVLLWLMLAVFRAPLGLEAADESRYVYLAAALFLPLMIVAADEMARRGPFVFLLTAILAGVWMIHNANLLLQDAAVEADRERLIREQLVAAGTLFESLPVLREIPEPAFTPDLDLEELRLLLSRFPQRVTPTREAVARASLALQVSITSRPELTGSLPTSRIRAVRARIQDVPNGCAGVRAGDPEAGIAMPVGPTGVLSLRSEESLHLDMLLTAGEDYIHSAQITGGRPAYLNVAVDPEIVRSGTLLVRFLGRLLVCPSG